MNEFYIYVPYGYRIPDGALHFDYSDWRGWADLIMLLVWVAWCMWMACLDSQKEQWEDDCKT